MIADSSFLVALFNANDPLHTRAAADLASSEALLTIPDRILEETLTVLSYKFGWKHSLGVLDKIRENRRFEIRHLSEDEWARVIAISAEAEKKISFPDYVVIYLSRSEGTLPLTYDAQIVKLAKKGLQPGA